MESNRKSFSKPASVPRFERVLCREHVAGRPLLPDAPQPAGPLRWSPWPLPRPHRKVPQDPPQPPTWPPAVPVPACSPRVILPPQTSPGSSSLPAPPSGPAWTPLRPRPHIPPPPRPLTGRPRLPLLFLLRVSRLSLPGCRHDLLLGFCLQLIPRMVARAVLSEDQI